MALGFLLLLFSIPVGYALKKITREEIEQGRHYFRIILIASLILAVVFLVIDISYNLKLPIIFTLLFIANVAFISWKK